MTIHADAISGLPEYCISQSAGQRHGAFARSEETIGAELAGVISRDYKALVHLGDDPLKVSASLGLS